MKKILNILRVFFAYCLLFTILFFCNNCKKDSDFNSLDIQSNEGICIYPLKSKLVIYPHDTVFSSIEQLGDEPYITYNDIVYYDTVFHIIQLKYTVTRLKQKLDQNNLRFAVTLNREILYRGNFNYQTANMLSNEPVIILTDELDTLGPNKIRIYQQFPIISSDNYNDLRYQPELNKLLKSDNKACGTLFNSQNSYNDGQGNGIEFYFIEGINAIEGVADFSRKDLIESNINFANLKLAASPFITNSQIAFYDSSQNIFYLRQPVDFSNYTYQQIIDKFYAITINGMPVVAGGFYLMMYSAPSPYIHIFPDRHYQNPINKYLLRLYPGYLTKNSSTFLINSPLLIQRLARDGKLKNNFII